MFLDSPCRKGSSGYRPSWFGGLLSWAGPGAAVGLSSGSTTCLGARSGCLGSAGGLESPLEASSKKCKSGSF